MNTKNKKHLLVALTTVTLLSSATTIPSIAFGEYQGGDGTKNLNNALTSQADYTNWYNTKWNNRAEMNSGQIVLTPGQKPTDLNFAWYSENVGTPSIKISTHKDMSDAYIVNGKSQKIHKTNGFKTYLASNHVSLQNHLKENTKYYYQYGINETYSDIYEYQTHSFQTFQAILVGDPQIGASSSNGQGTNDDLDIAINTYAWNKTLQTAHQVAPNASFILSAGDQIDYSDSGKNGEGNKIREQEYAGFFYPELLRSIPLATTIGNHESKVDDYSLHYNNPHASTLGQTESGGDYYYSYGDTLFISLNSNSRNMAEHRQLMKEATASHKDAKWKVVMFHHDIYGSGSPHADVDGANLRILFAPLMDEFNIDVCLTGHDHSYARTFQIKDGKVKETAGVSENTSEAFNPEGTLYIAAGSATGSKFYTLNKTKQYFIAERSNDPLPTFSTIDFSDKKITIKTYDYNGHKYAYDVTLNKDNAKTSLETQYEELKNIDQTTLTTGSNTRINDAINVYNQTLDHRNDTKATQLLESQFNKDSDPLNYYAYANEDYKHPQTKALKQGFSSLLDKTLYENASNTVVTTAMQTKAYQALVHAKEEIVTKADYNNFKQQLDKASSIDQTKYTQESLQAYLSKINIIQTSLDEQTLTQTQLKQHQTTLSNLKNTLITIKDDTTTQNTPSQNKPTQNHTPNTNESLQKPVQTSDQQPILISFIVLLTSLLGILKFKKHKSTK